MGAGSSVVSHENKEQSKTSKKKRRDDSPAAIAMRKAMREGFRTVQLVEAVSNSKEEILRKKRCGLVAIEEADDEMKEGGEGDMSDADIMNKAEEFKSQGNDFIRKKHDFKSAVKAYTTAISFLKTNYVYYNNRAAALLLAGEYDKAIADCDTSLDLKENIKAYTRKASALGELGKFDSAIDCIIKALALNPEDKETLHVQRVLLDLKEEKMTANAISLTSNSPSKDGVEKSGNYDENKGIDPPRIMPTDRIKLAPLKGANGLRRLKRQVSSGITYPREIDNCTFEVSGIGLPGSLLSDNGKIVRFNSSDIEGITGMHLSLPSVDIPNSLFQDVRTPPSRYEVDRFEKTLRDHLRIRGGLGGVFRAKNERTSAIGGLCVWKYRASGKCTDCIGCWNPFEYSNGNDWCVGDKVQLLDFIPSLFMKINRTLSEINIEDGEKQLCCISDFFVTGNAALMGGDAKNIAYFGQCGVIGDLWGPMKLEARKMSNRFYCRLCLILMYF